MKKWFSLAPKRLRSLLSIILLFSGVLLLSQTSSVQEAQAQGAFGYRKSITVQSGQVSSGPHTNFPMLVSFTDPKLKTVAYGGYVASYNATNNDPQDIIFRALDTTTCGPTAPPCTLDHEIEKYTASTGELVAWVRVPSINNGTVIYMYYGNSSISSSTAKPTGVWDANYTGVWHFKEGSGTTAADPTGHVNMSLQNVTWVTGEIDGSLQFAGTDASWGSLGNNYNFGTGPFTASVWVKGGGAGQGILVKDNWAGTSNGFYLYKTAASPYYYAYWNGTATIFVASADGGWHLLTVVRSGTGSNQASVYADGSLVSNFTESRNLSNAITFWVANTNSSGYSFSGSLDEIRISNSVRSSYWIQTEYNNQSSPATFYSVQDLNYQYRKLITIDHTKLDATNCTSALSNFPVLISRVNDTDLKNHVTNSNGYDIIFRSSDDSTPLNHEVEYYGSSSGTLVAWVSIPTLSNSADTSIYMYYGNSAITSATANPNGVWDANFKGVWHLPNGTTLSATDSTSNANNGTASSVTATTGQIDGAGSFNGIGGGSNVNVGSKTNLDFTTQPITAEAWINTSDVTKSENPIFYHADGPNNKIMWGAEINNKNLVITATINGGIWTQYTSTSNGITSNNTWYHVVCVIDLPNQQVTFYVNGSKLGNTVSLANNYIVNFTGIPNYIGYKNRSLTSYPTFQGTLTKSVSPMPPVLPAGLKPSTTTRALLPPFTVYGSDRAR